MKYKLVFSERSDFDTSDALIYYDAISKSLGDRFLTELKAIYKKLEKNPQHYSFISSLRQSTIRDVKLPSFPFVVIFDINGNSVIIISVMNSYRKPLEL